MATKFDTIILGGGAAGLVAAKFARGLGGTVLIIEKEKLGGECTWTGCVPSKALIRSAQATYDAQHIAELGISLLNNASVDTSNVMKHVQKITKRIYQTHTPDQLAQEDISAMFGSPHFIDPYHININNKIVTSKKIIIATGSSPLIPSINNIENVSYLTNQTIFSLEQPPSSMVIIGAGPIGIELASAFNRLGTTITVIENSSTILPREDREMTKRLLPLMQQEGINFILSSSVTTVSQKQDLIDVTYQTKDKNLSSITTKALLVATGRIPNIQGLNLEKAGVAYTKKSITVNNKLQTTQKHIFACGDVAGPFQFSHIADYQALIAVRNASFPLFKKKVSYKDTVWVTFCAPELARSGLTQDEAHALYGDAITVYRVNYENIDRPVIDGKAQGIAKIICNKKGSIIGAHILGARAGELIHELHVAKTFSIPLYKLHHVIHAYPTYCDVIKKLARMCYIDRVRNNPLAKLYKKVFPPKN